MAKLEDGSLYVHLGITVFETVMGFILGTVLGAALAAVLWWSPFLSKILDPYLVVLNAMPKVALGGILIVSMVGFSSIVAMGVIISVIVTTIVIYTAFRDVGRITRKCCTRSAPPVYRCSGKPFSRHRFL